MIDEMAWEATPSSVRARIDEGVPGGYRLQGTGGLQQVRLELFYVDAPGSYSIGVGGTVVGASGSVSRAPSIWQTPASGEAGTLVVTELSPDRIVGTFQMVLVPVPGSQASGMVVVTDGEFDVPIEDEVREVGPAHGRTVSAEIDGEPFHAATVVLTPYMGGIAFNAIDDTYNLGFLLSEVDAPGTYMLTLDTPSRGVVAVGIAGGAAGEDASWVVPPGDAGSITFTTLSEERLVGTFEVTLDPGVDSTATEPLVITAGEFDVGREDP